MTGFIVVIVLVWLIVALLAAIRVALVLVRRARLARAGMLDIDRMGGRVFEEYLEIAFKRLGYRVERTRFVGDYGGDLVLSKDGTRTVVQAKRYAKNVGVRAVQEAVAAKGAYDCSAAMVVSNSFYTQQAQHLARKNGVELWDRDRLAAVLMQTRAKSDRARTTAEESIAVGVVGAAPTSSTNRRATVDEAIATVESCASCGKVLTPGERAYCERNARRFGGRMLCYRHQRSSR